MPRAPASPARSSGAVAFFDGVFIGAPIAVLAASFPPLLVYVVATVVVVFLVIGCCRWVDRRWDDWFSGNGTRIEKRLEKMRASRLMAHPVAWTQRGSDRWYALAAAVANPILVATFARFVGGKPIGERRIRGPWRMPSRTWRCGRSSVSRSARRSGPSRAQRDRATFSGVS